MYTYIEVGDCWFRLWYADNDGDNNAIVTLTVLMMMIVFLSIMTLPMTMMIVISMMTVTSMIVMMTVAMML